MQLEYDERAAELSLPDTLRQSRAAYCTLANDLIKEYGISPDLVDEYVREVWSFETFLAGGVKVRRVEKRAIYMLTLAT
jgi:hypothetical protein